MSEEIATADANLDEIARLRTQLADVRAALAQQKRTIEAAHRAIEIAQADNAAWIAFVKEAAWQLEHGARCEEIQSDIYEAYDRAIKGKAPGAALLAELEAARAENAALRPEVRAFAGLMEAKLRENDHKPGWKQDDPYALYRRLCEEVAELLAALKKPFAVADETADVANFAMMIADVCGWLVVPTDHPGAALLAELEAARAVVAVVRWAVKEHYAPPPMCDALSAYDEAMEARPT